MNEPTWAVASLFSVMAKHLLTFPDGEKAIFETDWDPKTCSIKFEIRILDPDDTSWMEFPAEKVIQTDEKISEEIEKLMKNEKK